MTATVDDHDGGPAPTDIAISVSRVYGGMDEGRLRRVAAVVLVLAVATWVVWALVTLNAADSPLSVVGPGETGGFGGASVGVGALAAGAVLLAVGVVVARWLARRVGRAPPT